MQRKTYGVLLAALVAALSTWAESRDVKVSSCEQSRGRVTAINFTFTASQEPSQLWMAYGDSDGGENCKDWQNRRRIADVPAAMTSYRYELPDDFAARYCRFFLTGTDSPYEQELTYVRATGTQYVVLPDQGGKPGNYHVEADVTFGDDNNGSYLFGSANQGGNTSAFGVHVFSSKLAFYYAYWKTGVGLMGGDAVSSVLVEGGRRYKIAVDGNQGLFVDGEFGTESPTAPSTFGWQTNMFVFARSKAGVGAYDLCKDLKLHSFKLWDDYNSLTEDHLKFDFVPCIKDGIVGLYNKADAGGVFLASATADQLESGDEEFNTCATLQGVTSALALEGDDRVLTEVKLSGGKRPIRADISLTAGIVDVSLVAVCGPTDCGMSLDDWALANRHFIAALPADVTSTNVTLPFGWSDDVKCVRFFLMERYGSAYDQELAYVQATGAQYVELPDQGGKPGNYHVEADMTFGDDNNGSYLFGSANQGGNSSAFGVHVSSRNLAFYYAYWQTGVGNVGGDAVSSVPSEGGRRYEIAVDGDRGLFVDGDLGAKSPADPSTFGWQTNMFVFARSKAGVGASDLCKDVKLHSFRIWDDYGSLTEDHLKFDLVPCVKNGVVGLYNKAGSEGGFLASATATSLVAGPETVNGTARVLYTSAPYAKPCFGLCILVE